MTQLPPPPIQPFERLQVSDGLLVNADRWRRAHEYHRQRQNFHYQALNQPGIVCGLGVRLMPAPTELELRPEHKDGRWVQLQPGIAIDVAGNPIIVPHPENYRIVSEPQTQDPLVVYLVVQYVDPDKLTRKDNHRDTVRETFRIDEKTSPPNEFEVEVCRILLQPGTKQLISPTDVFFPAENALDLRHRIPAQARCQARVQIAQVIHPDFDGDRTTPLTYLLASCPALYPSLSGQLGTIALEANELESAPYDLLYLTGQQALLLQEPQLIALKHYFSLGGTLLVDVPVGGTALAKSMMDLAEQLGTPLEYLEQLHRNHPLRTQPFLFSALPTLNDQPARLLIGGGIILVIGDLASSWGLDEQLTRSRTDIRSAQEFGINLLHFAWRKRQMITLMGSETTDASLPAVRANVATSLPLSPISTEVVPEKQSTSKSKHILDQLIDRNQ